MAKFIIVVMDSVGIGALPDAHLFGDEGSDTLGHIIEAYPDIKLNNLGRLGLCLLKDLPCSTGIIGAYGRAAEKFPGKDTTGGHFEIAGLVLDKPFRLFRTASPRISWRLSRRLSAARPSATTRPRAPRLFRNWATSM
jgi:phosphopentomutase